MKTREELTSLQTEEELNTLNKYEYVFYERIGSNRFTVIDVVNKSKNFVVYLLNDRRLFYSVK